MEMTFEIETTDDILIVTIFAHYCVIGVNRPATRFEPADYAEVEITGVDVESAVDYDGNDIELTDELKAEIKSKLSDEALIRKIETA